MARKPKNMRDLWDDVFDENPKPPVKRRRKAVLGAEGPWGTITRQSVPAVHGMGDDDDENFDTEYYAEVHQPRHDLAWFFFRAPGAVILWIAYYIPQRGHVVSSARQRGHVFFEIAYSIGFWCALLFLGFMAITNNPH